MLTAMNIFTFHLPLANTLFFKVLIFSIVDLDIFLNVFPFAENQNEIILRFYRMGKGKS